jgi:hypothetical protein
MRQNHLSKARAWEYALKDGAWGVDELGFSQLPACAAGAGMDRGDVHGCALQYPGAGDPGGDRGPMRKLLAAAAILLLTIPAYADGPPPPNGPPLAGPPCPPPPVNGLVLTPRGWTATPYVYAPGGLPPVRRGPRGEVGYPYPVQAVAPGACGFPSAVTYPPAPDYVPNWSFAPWLPPAPGFFYFPGRVPG